MLVIVLWVPLIKTNRLSFIMYTKCRTTLITYLNLLWIRKNGITNLQSNKTRLLFINTGLVHAFQHKDRTKLRRNYVPILTEAT